MGEAVERARISARRLMREVRFASLGTLEAKGGPYVSLVAVAPDEGGAPTLLISGLARHTQNIERDGRASLLVTSGGADGDPLDAPRVSLLGRIAPRAAARGDGAIRARFLARHPAAEIFAGFSDFAFYSMAVEEAHLVEGFGRVVTLPPQGLLTDWIDAEALREAAAGILEHMNKDHADAIGLYATGLLDEPAEKGPWRLIGLDPEGCEIAAGDTVRRLDFPHRVITAFAAREVFVKFAAQAKAGTK